MTIQYDLHFEITRDDWIAVTSTLLHESPHWEAAARRSRAKDLRQMLWLGPLIVVFTAWLIGRSGSTKGMYVEGALAGVLLVGLRGTTAALPRSGKRWIGSERPT
jgi:hypothetical protein